MGSSSFTWRRSTLRLANGQPYIDLGGQIAPLTSRNLNNTEADLIIKLLRKLELNYQKTNKNYSKSVTLGLESINGNIENLIKDITMFGEETKYSKKETKEARIYLKW